MMTRWIRNRAVLGMSLAATVAATALGCGGGEATDSVVVPPPSAKVTSGGPAANVPAPAPTAGAGAGAPAPSATPGAAPAAAATASGWGTLKGQIVFGGEPPAPKVLEAQGKAEKDPDMCAVTAPILSERLVVDNATKGVKNVLVYLPRPTSVNEDARKAAAAAAVVFDQKGCTFEPHVLGLMKGVPVTLKSSDPKSHNVNAKLRNNSDFGNKTIAGNQSIVYTPQSSERMPGEIVCDIHSWMRAYWMVLDNPYIAVTDAKGNYEIKNIPAGPQKLVVWQESAGFVTAPSGDEIALKANDVNVKDFTIDPTKVKLGN